MKHSFRRFCDSDSLYGPLPRDCWELTGKRCKFTSKMKIAATCTKLRDLYFQHFALEKWLTFLKDREYNKGLYKSAAAGERQLVDFFISKCNEYCIPVNWIVAFNSAVRGGHRDLIDFFIPKCEIKGDNQIMWNYGLQGAAIGGHRVLIDFFIAKGATQFNWGLDGAAEGGHRDLIDLFISKGADHWNYGLAGAAIGGHRDLVDFFISKGALAFDWGVARAKRGDHHDLVYYLNSRINNAAVN